MGVVTLEASPSHLHTLTNLLFPAGSPVSLMWPSVSNRMLGRGNENIAVVTFTARGKIITLAISTVVTVLIYNPRDTVIFITMDNS